MELTQQEMSIQNLDKEIVKLQQVEEVKNHI